MKIGQIYTKVNFFSNPNKSIYKHPLVSEGVLFLPQCILATFRRVYVLRQFAKCYGAEGYTSGGGAG